MKDFYIMPYMEIDGIATFTNSTIMGMYDRIIEEGKNYVFMDGTIPDREAFLFDMKSQNTLLYVVYQDKTIVGIVWLNRFEGALARLHWCTFDGVSMRTKIKAGRYINERLSRNFDLLIGYTPESNKAAIKFIELCGGEIVGTVPNLIWNEQKQMSESGVISFYRRKTHENL